MNRHTGFIPSQPRSMSDSDATVIATYRRRVQLRLTDGREVGGRVKGRKLKPVCGDRVVTEPLEGEADWLITSIAKRRNALTRPDLRGNKDVLAANLDLLVVVASVLPKADWFVVDRYLCAAERMRADGLVVLNKCDLDVPDSDVAALRVYRDIGYRTLCTSAKTGDDIQALGLELADRTAILVGQSGVGKSSLINCLSGEARLKTATISRKHREGKHTTVSSVMIPLTGGGTVIDSPGVRDYAPYLESALEAATGYREIRALGERCRFADCSHRREPDCAVKAAVDDGSIDSRRYESYRRTLALTERLVKERGP